MYKLLVTAGGTGSAWHICSIAKQYFKDSIELYVCDTNEPYLVAASTLADHFFTVPPVRDPGYRDYMYQLLARYHIDAIIPLIPWEQEYFSNDNPDFSKLGVYSLAAKADTNRLFNDKIALHDYCQKSDIPTIRIYEADEVVSENTYFIKAKDGFGAQGAAVKKGSDITKEDAKRFVIQEYCLDDGDLNEITVEVFNDDGQLHLCGRRRLENKCGVCTKAEFVDVSKVRPYIEKMVSDYDFPYVFNVQFIRHDEQWKVMDVNLRLAAGTGLSASAGFSLIRCLLSKLLTGSIDRDMLKVDETIKTVVRVYEEVVIR